MIDDIPSIVEIVEHFSRNRTSCPEFSDFVCDLICPSMNPPVIQKNSDLMRSKKIMKDYFTLLGELLATFENDYHQNRVLDVIECLISRRKLADVAAVKVSICQEAMEDSELPYVVAVLMETVSYDLYFRYLDLAVQIILVSLKSVLLNEYPFEIPPLRTILGYVMLQCNVLHSALCRLNFCGSYSLARELPKNSVEESLLNEYYTLLEKSSYLIWGLLSIICKCDAQVPCPGEDALVNLRIVFESECTKKCQKALDARNNLAGLMVKLCFAFGDKLAMLESGLGMDIAVISVATEIGAQGTWVEACHLGTKKEDFMLKKLMLLCCCLINSNKKFVETTKSFKVIDGILRLIDPKEASRWIPTQYIDLFYTALRALSELVPAQPEVYVLNKGNARLLSVMKLFMDKHFDRDALLELLKTFSTIVLCEKNECIITDILEQNGVEFLLELCTYILNLEVIKLEDQEKLCRIFIVLERTLRNQRKMLSEHSDSCVSISVALLKRVLNNLNYDSKWNPRIFISFGAFMWETIAWCPSSLPDFTEKGGIYLILDLIEMSTFPVQMFLLGVLVDMADDGKCISSLMTWRGKEGYGIVDLLIAIWRKEEEINKVHRTKDGVIEDIEMPLMTEEQWYVTHQIKGSHNYSPSIAEMMCSARPKIYALFKFLHERHAALRNMSESFYELYLKNVRPSYQVYIPLIDHYLMLKMGEVWFEVLRDTSINGILPTAYDGEVMGTLIDERNIWSARIKTMQEEIMLIQRKNNADKEGELYELLKSNRLSTSLEALAELDYIARTSSRKFQLQKKRKQINDVENSLKILSITPDQNIHRTFMYKTNATCFCGSYVKIKSEKEVYEHDDITIVSSDLPEENYFDE
ncbi:hypothetical protein RUM43_005877 [Polyplax serrata]|uniref:Cilia- and flagella-associated protein 69 ARM repeats domain-containing protein n=1 Tax=Polyplax serrata TaxID=468196 RepID=A0AAN8NS33_POLSC